MKPTLPPPWASTSGLQKCKKIHVCCFSRPARGTELQQPWQTHPDPATPSPTCKTRGWKPLEASCVGQWNAGSHTQPCCWPPSSGKEEMQRGGGWRQVRSRPVKGGKRVQSNAATRQRPRPQQLRPQHGRPAPATLSSLSDLHCDSRSLFTKPPGTTRALPQSEGSDTEPGPSVRRPPPPRWSQRAPQPQMRTRRAEKQNRPKHHPSYEGMFPEYFLYAE